MTRSNNSESLCDSQHLDKRSKPSILSTKSTPNDQDPTTDHASRKTMLRAERRDSIKITAVKHQFEPKSIPTTHEVIQRTETYFGPELLLAANDQNFLLTAPGPDSHLLLWQDQVNNDGYRINWTRTAEVQAKIQETIEYKICDQCGYPIRSEEHERLSIIGRCSDGS